MPGNSTEGLDMLMLAYRYVFSWLVPCVYVIGCTGTIICIVVLLRRHTTQKEVRPWFIAVSIMDIYLLSLGLLMMYYSIVTKAMTQHRIQQSRLNSTHQIAERTDLNLRSISRQHCYSFSILHYYGLLAATWLQVGISTLRCLSAVIPLTSRHKVTVRSSKRALWTTLAIPMAISLGIVCTSLKYTYKEEAIWSPELNRVVVMKTWTCTRREESHYYFYASLVLRACLPALCLVVSTGIILHSLQRFKRAFHNEAGRRLLQQRRVSFILIGMNTTFLLLVLPYEAYMFYATINRTKILKMENIVMAKLKIVEESFALLMYINNATNWIFYFVLGKRFRQEIHRQVSCLSVCRAQRPQDAGFRFLGCASGVRTRRVSLEREVERNDVELQRLREARYAAPKQIRSLESVTCHAGHRVCHINFNKISSV